MEGVFRRTWLAVARESDVARTGDCLAVDELGEALLVVRGDDGAVRTFRNACRHRGTRLVTTTCHAKHLRCPYHAWTYALDGRLQSVPEASGFSRLDRDALGLHSVRTECWGGFVWTTFDAGAPPVRRYLGMVAEQLEPYRLEDMRPLHRRTWTLECNWKAVLDNATESYHVRAVHTHSIAPYVNAPATFYGLDPHHLQTFPIADYQWRARLDRLSTPRDLPVTPDQVRLLHKYVIFPNTLVNVMPYHLTVFRVFPLGPGTCRLHYEFHLRQRAGGVARARGWLTLAASLLLLREDIGILEPFQAGVRAVRQPIPFHQNEGPLEYFHGVLDRHVGATG